MTNYDNGGMPINLILVLSIDVRKRPIMFKLRRNCSKGRITCDVNCKVAPYLLYCYNSQLKDVGDIMNCIQMKTLRATKTVTGLDILLTATSETW